MSRSSGLRLDPESVSARGSLRALIIDDVPDDAVLMAAALQDGGFRVAFERVDSAAGLEAALRLGPWDVILSDHAMPGFSSERALERLAELDSAPPVIVVSGAIGEEATVAAMRAGAVDFVSKDRLVRLPAAVARALNEAALERERRRLEEELQFHSEHDPLSGLFNRRRFASELAAAVAQAERYPDAAGSLLLIDLDHFKYVNDTLGHRAGDEMLAAVARALSTRMRESDVIARVGGDEFAVVLPHTPLGAATEVAHSLCEAAAGLMIVANGRKVRTTLSIGAVPLGAGMSGEDALALADIAMYEAKEHGRDRVVALDRKPAAMVDQLGWAERLREALALERFELYSQPIVEIASGRVDRYELLLRLREEDGRIVLPGAFVGVAERFGLIGEIDRWVVRRAVAALAAQPRGASCGYMVNLSGVSIGDPQLLPLIAAEIERGGIDPARLVFEVTETAAITDIQTASEFMHGLRRIGCGSALDDFGSGFGSVVRVPQAPARRLPQDRRRIRAQPARHRSGPRARQGDHRRRPQSRQAHGARVRRLPSGAGGSARVRGRFRAGLPPRTAKTAAPGAAQRRSSGPGQMTRVSSRQDQVGARPATEGPAQDQASERLGAAILEALRGNGADAIAVSDRDSGRFVMVSDAYCELTGYAREELLGASSLELGLVASRAARSEALEHAVKGTTGTHELRLRRKDGATKLVEFSAQLLGEGPLMLTINRDVTERRGLESRLLESELRLRAIIDSITDAVAISSSVRDDQDQIVDFRWEYVNDAYCALLGFERERLLGRRGSELFPDFLESERFAVYRQVVRTGVPAKIETVHPIGALDGAGARLIENSVIGFGDHMAVSGRDITERHEAEAKLAASEERFRAAMESMLDSFTIISAARDEDGEIVDFRYEYVNDAYCEMVGFAREQLLGRLLGEVYAGYRGSERFALHRQVVLTREPARTEQISGDRLWSGTALAGRALEMVIVPMDAQLVITGRDVTERRDAERRIQDLNMALDRRAVELEAANRELETFAYSVAHDLRTPLRAIAGFTGLLARDAHIGPQDEQGQALIARTTAAAARMGELIDALLELSQLARSRLELTSVDLSAIAREVAEQLRSGDPSRQVEFVIGAGLHARADRRLARTVLRSLLENAWKYTSRREQARIELAAAGPGVFVVRDNGAGFDMEFADQLFRPFGRLHRQDEFPGTGVGLATAERIVHRHGGTLKGEGQVDRGAAFYFSLEPS